MELSVITNDINKNFVPKCIIYLDNKTTVFDEFVTVGFSKDTSGVVLLSFADTLTLCMAYKLIKQTFMESYNELPEESKQLMEEFL